MSQPGPIIVQLGQQGPPGPAIGSSRTVTTGSTFAFAASDIYGLVVFNLTVALAVSLPAAANINDAYQFKDQLGLAPTHNITVSAIDGALIDGQVSQTFATKGCHPIFRCTAAGVWSIVG